jgi:hypothetical protein
MIGSLNVYCDVLIFIIDSLYVNHDDVSLFNVSSARSDTRTSVQNLRKQVPVQKVSTAHTLTRL